MFGHVGDVTGSVDDTPDSLDGGNRLPRMALEPGNPVGDLIGSAGGLVGQILHFSGDNRKAITRITGAGRLDGGVEREQVGLASDESDQLGCCLPAFMVYARYLSRVKGSRCAQPAP